ncbi:MAG TPA: hypothetical protein VKN99_02890 [Polyangia bacterium]|nr:hypothetical protein [Polyangia bacterium]
MRKALSIGVVLLAAAGSARARPVLVAGVGAGVDVEPSRPNPAQGGSYPSADLAAFSFEGEILWSQLGLLARGVGVDGSIDYQSTGFDRFALTVAGTFRPLAHRLRPDSYARVVASRLAVELGLTYQRILATYNTADNLGLHLGAHADFPLGMPQDDHGVFVRLIVQRPIILIDDTISNGIAPDPFNAGAPSVQLLGVLAVAF